MQVRDNLVTVDDHGNQRVTMKVERFDMRQRLERLGVGVAHGKPLEYVSQ